MRRLRPLRAAFGRVRQDCCERLEPIVSPVLESQVIFDRSMLKQTVAALRILEDEDPSLGVSWNEALGELRVHIMGVIQYDVIRELMKERFEIDVDFGKCSVMYRETIASDVIGCGHYEPLRHYARGHSEAVAGGSAEKG